MEHQPALLQWVLIDDEMKHISSYAHLKPKERPKAICPACEKPVIMKLGNQKVHHVAHAPGSDCALTNPESALHYNCKMHVAGQLQKLLALKITERCISCHHNERDMYWQRDWDEVRVERKLSDGLQPDVALWKNNQPIAAIEIFVTHAVNQEKSNRLITLGIPWIEIKGQPSLYLGESAWQAGTPIPADKTSWKSTWRCSECKKAEQQRVARLEWERLNGEKTICFKLMDWFFPSGTWLRCLFTINKVLKDGQIIEFNLSCVKTYQYYQRIKFFANEKNSKIGIVDASQNEQEVIKKLQAKGRAYLARKRTRHNLIFDSPMPWVYDNPGRFDRYNDEMFPRRQNFDRKTKEWITPEDKKSELWYQDDGTPIHRERHYWHRGEAWKRR